MGRPQARKGTPAKNKRVHRAQKTKHFTAQPDQIWEAINRAQTAAPAPDVDLPGRGQFHCKYCARHFVCEKSLSAHSATKDHRRQVKRMSEQPYNLKEANLLNKY